MITQFKSKKYQSYGISGRESPYKSDPLSHLISPLAQADKAPNVYMNENLPLRIQEELKKWPFIWEARKFPRPLRGLDGKFEPEVQREIIRCFLRRGIPLVRRHIEFLREHPEHALRSFRS
ncbi:hypothetical protein V8C43DRAFT_291194 [Trichoderma afarasin]